MWRGWTGVEETVRAIHQRQVAEHGGGSGVRDEGLPTSALTRPRNVLAYGKEPDLAALAASYAFGIVRNHPFVDGNKRTALVAARTFLLLNGVNLAASQEEKYPIFLHLAEGSVSEEQLSEWIGQHLKS